MRERLADAITASLPPAGRQFVWDAIRAFGGRAFTHGELNRATDVNRRTVNTYLGCLTAGGYLERIEGGELLQWRQIRDCHHAPQLRPDGTPVRTGGGTANMWRSMRMLGQFTTRELAAHSTTDTVQVAEQTAKRYVSELLAAGYLRVVQKAIPMRRQATYRLIRNTGPLPPKVQRLHRVLDPNLNPPRTRS